MTRWKRWQDYATMAFGVILFISPFVLGEGRSSTPSVTAYVLGALLFVSGVVAAATRQARRSLIVNAPGIAAAITFVAALVLGFGGVRGIAYVAGLLAILTIAVGATFRLGASETKTA